MMLRGLFAGLVTHQKPTVLAHREEHTHGEEQLKLDYQMLKTLEFLAEKPLVYEYQHQIQAIERAIRCGIAIKSDQREEFIQGRWRSVCTVSVAPTETWSVT